MLLEFTYAMLSMYVICDTYDAYASPPVRDLAAGFDLDLPYQIELTRSLLRSVRFANRAWMEP